MSRLRGVRFAFLLGAVALVGLALTACDTTPPMITGTVTFDGGTTPASGLAVTAFASGSQTVVASVTVGTDGRFTFRQSVLPAGSYRIRFGAATWWGGPDWSGATPVVASEATPPDLALSVPAGAITGTVGDFGSPMVGATVQALVPGSGAVATSTTSDGTGHYVLAVPEGQFLVRFSKPGRVTKHYGGGSGTPWISNAWPVTVASGGTVSSINANLGLQGAPMTGRLLDGTAPVAGAVVAALHPTLPDVEAQAVTAADGSFTIPNLSPGAHRLRVTRTGVAAVVLPGTYDASSYELGTLLMPSAACAAPVLAPGADLTGCDLRGMDLAGVDLTGAALAGVRSGGNTGTPTALPEGWLLRSGYLIGPRSYLVRAALGSAQLSAADLTGAQLGYAGLAGADLAGAHLGTAVLRSATLEDADLVGADLGQAEVAGASLRRAKVAGANLDGLDLGSSSLGGLRSGPVSGTPATLPAGWALYSGWLAGPEVDLSGAALGGLDLSGADLAGATLTDADLAGTDLSGAVLTLVRSGGVTGAPAALPVDWNLRYGYLMGSYAVLVGADLADADLGGVDLHGANLTGAVLARALLGSANLYSSILTGVDLTDADFRFSGPVGIGLGGVTSGGIIGTPLNLPQGWQLHGGYLFGTNAYFSGADLSGLDLATVQVPGGQFYNSDLSGADLSSAYLVRSRFQNVNVDGANLSGADLTDVISSGLTGTPLALPAGWSISGGTLVYNG